MTEDQAQEKIAPNLLIAVDGSRASLGAANYVLSLLGIIPNMVFNLLYITPMPPPILTTEAKTDGAMRGKLRKLQEAYRKEGEQLLAATKEMFVNHGVAEERVLTTVRSRHAGLAKDIINEAVLGRFDSLVVGRRGLTRAQEVFMGSVSNQLIQHSAGVPLWIIDGKVTKPNILVAVDGSPASLRVVDHVAYMLGGNPEAVVDFVHVSPKLQNYCPIDLGNLEGHWTGMEDDLKILEQDFNRGQEVCMDDFYEKAAGVLSQAGFTRERIRFEEREVTLGVARTIVKAAREGKYGTIVVGRRGLGRSSFLGSISDRVIRRASNLAVWLVN